jgi:RHS repeat-associated protein
LGNGIVEQTYFNNRLQPCEITAFQGAFGGGAQIMDLQYLYGTGSSSPCANGAQNNGNLYGIVDNTNPAGGSTSRSHWFAYDGLNRLMSYTRGASVGGNPTEAYYLDDLGNMSVIVNGSHRRFDASNRIKVQDIPCATYLAAQSPNNPSPYDGAGNLRCDLDEHDGFMQFGWDAENRLQSILTAGSTDPYVKYSYGPDGSRSRKDMAAGTWTEYMSLGGQQLSEHRSDGTWTDWIYANGKKVAKAGQTYSDVYILKGTRRASDSGCDVMVRVMNWWQLGFVGPIQPGDTLSIDQRIAPTDTATFAIGGGVQLTSGGGGSWNLYDQDGRNEGFASYTDGQWHHRVFDIGAGYPGQNLDQLLLFSPSWSSVGDWEIDDANFTYTHADGTVSRFTTSSIDGVQIACGQYTQLSGSSVDTNGSAALMGTASPGPVGSSTYYLHDHLGSTQMELSSTGSVLWQGEYTPYGQEIQNGNPIPPGISAGSDTQYKFTGKERDAESGLDYFPARYYGSNMGRWMAPDPGWLAAVDLANPQTLNAYSYVTNSPLIYNDPTGMWGCDSGGALPTASNAVLSVIFSVVRSFACGEDQETDHNTIEAYGHGVRQQMPNPVQPHSTHPGQMPAPNNVVKHYGVTVPCSSSASQVMGAVESNFAAFGNYSSGPFSLSFGTPPMMGVGAEIPITAGYFGLNQNMGVSVQSMSSSSMSFSTLPGRHLLYPAGITFSASSAGNGAISFNINLAGNFNGLVNGAKYYLGGAAFENAQWNHFLGKVSAYCSLGANAYNWSSVVDSAGHARCIGRDRLHRGLHHLSSVESLLGCEDGCDGHHTDRGSEHRYSVRVRCHRACTRALRWRGELDTAHRFSQRCNPSSRSASISPSHLALNVLP